MIVLKHFYNMTQSEHTTTAQVASCLTSHLKIFEEMSQELGAGPESGENCPTGKVQSQSELKTAS